MGVKKKSGAALAFEDFLPTYAKPKKKQKTDEEIEMMFASLATNTNGQ